MSDAPKQSRKEMAVEELKAMISNIERLPSHAMLTPISHYDYCSLLIVLVAALEGQKEEY